MSETPDAPATDKTAPSTPGGSPSLAQEPAPGAAKPKSGSTARRGRGATKSTPAKRTPAKSSPAKSAGSTSRSSGSSAGDAAGSLAAALRGLVSGIEDEVSAISSLSSQIDSHVQELNDLRAEATRRLLHLDDLRGAAEDVNLSAFLDTSIQPQLPSVEEDFPDRIYGG